jgi:hypothetical protein
MFRPFLEKEDSTPTRCHLKTPNSPTILMHIQSEETVKRQNGKDYMSPPIPKDKRKRKKETREGTISSLTPATSRLGIDDTDET